MADFSGIASFGEGALQGWDKSLSNYRQIAEMARQREQSRRQEQALQLQNLLHGNKLAQESPEVAELAAQDPDRYGLSPDTVGPGAAQARAQRAAMARLNQALSTGDLEALNDPDVARNISEKHLPLIKEMQDRRKVDAIMRGPGTPQQKAQAIIGLGAKVDTGLLDRGFPEFAGAEAESRAAGTARGQLPLKESLAEAEAVGKGRGELQFKGRLAQAGKEGELRAELSPDLGAGVPAGGTSARRLATERETLAQAEGRRKGNTLNVIGPKDVSAALSRNRTQARLEVQQQMQNSPVFKALPPLDQQTILDYYSQVRQNGLMSQDPVMEGQQVTPLPPKPPAVTKFEAEGQPGPGFFSWLGGLVGGESETVPAPTSATPAPAQPQPRTIRQQGPTSALTPEQSAQIIRARGAQEGDTVTNKKTNQTWIVKNGVLVAQ